mmetsp:Transcript_25661/g.73785  ORF Transcript_25661/g.73785 Transcript_25661/m.73785 type:complete len:148 (-) Transcript_25661:121-564(-)
MASQLLRQLARFAPPVAAGACFAYAGRETWRAWQGPGEEAELHARWERDTLQLDEQRVAWASRVEGSSQPPRELYLADVLAEVHNMDALGPAGVRLRAGEKVQVLEEGSGREQGFSVVRAASGRVGIYPKAYLGQQSTDAAGAQQPK